MSFELWVMVNGIGSYGLIVRGLGLNNDGKWQVLVVFGNFLEWIVFFGAIM